MSNVSPSPGRKQWVYASATTTLVTLVLLLSYRFDANDRNVKRLVSQLSANLREDKDDDETIQALVRLGPAAYPELAKILQCRDTKLDELYERYRAIFPARLKQVLPKRQSKNEFRQCAQKAVEKLGPEACRALVGAIHDSLASNRPSPRFSSPQGVAGSAELALLRALYWSIPDSPKAISSLRDWLSLPYPYRVLNLPRDEADEIWATVPELAPILTAWLKFEQPAMNAAEALGSMGAKAAFAIPDLIDTYRNGVAGGPRPTRNPLNPDPFRWNRGAAIEALGNIGVANRDVLSTLQMAWGDSNPEIRALAADAVAKLGPKALPLLPSLLGNLDITSRIVLEYQIQAIGEMGPEARQAIPVLHRWLDSTAVATIPDWKTLPSDPTCWCGDPLPLPAGAAVALFQIAPGECSGLGKTIAEVLKPWLEVERRYTAEGKVPWWDQFARRKKVNSRLPNLQPLADEIIPALEPGLMDHRTWVQQQTAFHILCLRPGHPQARTLLVTAMGQANSPSLRAQAAVYFWRLTGDTNSALPVLRETLRTVRDYQSQAPLNYSAELGPAARPLALQIRTFLTNDDQMIRYLAGRALRRIDPTALPPINEGYP